MADTFKYASASEAVSKLKAMGFSVDFVLKDGYAFSGLEKFRAEDLKILYTARYEGNSDPGDETTVYGLETTTGLKGILVTADGIYADKNAADLLQKLHAAKLDTYSEKMDGL